MPEEMRQDDMSLVKKDTAFTVRDTNMIHIMVVVVVMVVRYQKILLIAYIRVQLKQIN